MTCPSGVRRKGGLRLKFERGDRVRRPEPANPTSPRHHHFIGAPTTAINATTVPAAAPAFTIGVAARHLMVDLRLLTFPSFPPTRGRDSDPVILDRTRCCEKPPRHAKLSSLLAPMTSQGLLNKQRCANVERSSCRRQGRPRAPTFQPPLDGSPPRRAADYARVAGIVSWGCCHFLWSTPIDRESTCGPIAVEGRKRHRCDPGSATPKVEHTGRTPTDGRRTPHGRTRPPHLLSRPRFGRAAASWVGDG